MLEFSFEEWCFGFETNRYIQSKVNIPLAMPFDLPQLEGRGGREVGIVLHRYVPP